MKNVSKIKRSHKKFLISNKFKCELINDDSNLEDKQCNIEKNENNNNNNIQINNVIKSMDKKKMLNQDKNRKRKVQKKSFYEKCAETRKEKGMILLPQKIETKIYKLKKALRKKGLDDTEIRIIIRKKRREEENKVHKEMKHLCFNCRQPGHSLANCPQAGDEESSDICYFCGSSEHKLSECNKYKSSGRKQENLPFAKCFICKKNGHLTSSCKDNQNGVFPKGGKCLICGSVNHLVKDCNKSKDKEKQEEINLKTYDSAYSVDADDFEMTFSDSKRKTNKVVKF